MNKMKSIQKKMNLKPRENKIKMTLSTLICDNCNQSFEYEDDGETFACMPDGEVVGSCWYCSDCCFEIENRNE